MSIIEKAGTIKNPLTIIAIFAGIAEVSGTIVLPFITESNQEIFIFFLIAFPLILVVLFFATLNFNHKVLYAPSDYSNEENFIKVSKFDVATKQNIIYEVAKDNSHELIMTQVREFSNSALQRFQRIEDLITTNAYSENSTIYRSFNEVTINRDAYQYLVTRLPNVEKFLELTKEHGFKFQIYVLVNENHTAYKLTQNYAAIWLGRNVPFEIAKELIVKSKKFYSHLQYIDISGDHDASFEEEDKLFYTGGATQTAIQLYNLQPIDDEGFTKIERSTNLKELHEIIRSYY